MADCIYYEQMDETEDQKIFRDYLMQCTDNLGHIYFQQPSYIDGKLYEGSESNYQIDDFVNPTYDLYEMVRVVKCKYKAKSGSSAFELYDLLIKCIPDQEYNLWEQKFEAKFKNKYDF